MTTKQQLLAALERFINQRSGIEYDNYGGSREAFMEDYKPILKHGRHARILLRAVELRETITADMIREATRAYSGRLQFIENEKGIAVDYTAGQYFPTEYRNAACAVLARCLWDWFAKDLNTGEEIRKAARREFGRSIASTWFN